MCDGAAGGHGQAMFEEWFAASPEPNLMAGQPKAGEKCCARAEAQPHRLHAPEHRGVRCPPREHYKQTNDWEVHVTIGHRLRSHLDKTNDRDQCSEKPEPANCQVWAF